MIQQCSVISVGCDLGKLTGAAAGGIGNDIVNAFAALIEQCAAAIVNEVLSLALTSSKISLSAPWFTARVDAMVSLMAIMLVPLLLAGTISAVIHQDLHRLGRTWLVGLPVAVCVTVVATDLTSLALTTADNMTKVVTSGVHLDVYNVLADAPHVPGTPPSVALVLSAVILLGALAVWMELLIRSAAVYIAVFFLPLALAGLVWPSTAHLTRRLIEGLVSLILMKFVIVATLSLGAAAVQNGQGVNQVATGTAILLVAAFAPFVLFRMVPVMEAASVGHLAGLSRAPLRAATSTMGMVNQGKALAGTASAAIAGLKGGPDPEKVGSGQASQRLAHAVATYRTDGGSSDGRSSPTVGGSPPNGSPAESSPTRVAPAEATYRPKPTPPRSDGDGEPAP